MYQRHAHHGFGRVGQSSGRRWHRRTVGELSVVDSRWSVGRNGLRRRSGQRSHGRSDVDRADVCKAEERAIVTLDLDFADIRAYPPDSYSGLIVLRLDRQGKADHADGRSAPSANAASDGFPLGCVSLRVGRVRVGSGSIPPYVGHTHDLGQIEFVL